MTPVSFEEHVTLCLNTVTLNGKEVVACGFTTDPPGHKRGVFPWQRVPYGTMGPSGRGGVGERDES